MCTLEIVLTLHTLHRGSRRVTYGTLTLPTTPTHAYVVNGKPAGRLGQKPSASLDVIVDRCMAVINIFCSRPDPILDKGRYSGALSVCGSL